MIEDHSTSSNAYIYQLSCGHLMSVQNGSNSYTFKQCICCDYFKNFDFMRIIECKQINKLRVHIKLYK